MIIKKRVVLIGGSAGSFRPVCSIIKELNPGFDFALVLVLHRLKNVNAGFIEALQSSAPDKDVCEPFDKDPVEAGKIYLAPANYHLCFDSPSVFSLNSDPPVQYSRPSIDYTLMSAAGTFGPQLTTIILSGANRDGVSGASAVRKSGGFLIVQEPGEAEIETMPGETLRENPGVPALSVQEIVRFLNNTSKKKKI